MSKVTTARIAAGIFNGAAWRDKPGLTVNSVRMDGRRCEGCGGPIVRNHAEQARRFCGRRCRRGRHNLKRAA